MTETEEKSARLRRLFICLATCCLVLSFLGVAQETIEQYSSAVAQEQFDKKMKAEFGATFSRDPWGINYAARDRHFIFVICMAGFCLSLSRRTFWFALASFGFTFPLIYQWINVMIRDLSFTEGYRPEIPYLFKIASFFDWAMFCALFVTFGAGVIISLANRKLE